MKKIVIIVMSAWFMLLVSNLLISDDIDAQVENKSETIDGMLLSDNMLEQEDGSWLLSEKEATLQVDWQSSQDKLSIILPKEGPYLFAPDNFSVAARQIEDDRVLHEVSWGAHDEEQAEFPFAVELLFLNEQENIPYIHHLNMKKSSESEGSMSLLHAHDDMQALDVTDDMKTDNMQTLSGLDDRFLMLEGRGFGHRTGQSQWGTQGLAHLGVKYPQILQHYYPGTQLETRYNDPDRDVTVRLNNGNTREYWRIRMDEEAKVYNSSGNPIATIRADVLYHVEASNNRISIQRVNDSEGEGNLINNAKLVTLDTTVDNISWLEISNSGNSREYFGDIQFQADEDRVRATNIVNMRRYLEGVVPYETPASFHIEALRTQAVTARTFVATRDFNVRDTTSDQVYGGVYYLSQYLPKVRQVVAETNGRVLTFNGNLAGTFYYSSNGGYMENNSDVWGSGGTPLPYLTARKDEYTLNGKKYVPEEYASIVGNGYGPHANYRWERSIPASAIEAVYGDDIGRLLGLEVVSRTAGQGADQLRINGAKGSVTTTGTSFRMAVGANVILSTYIFPQEMKVPVETERIQGSDRYETAVQVSQEGWPSANTVILVRGNDYADALTGVPLAHQLNAPVLLTERDRLNTRTRAEMIRLQAQEVYILGGESAISEQVSAELAALNVQVIRIAGEDRYETAEKVAQLHSSGGSDTAMVVSGENFPDGISAASYAARKGYPVLLSREQSVPDATNRAIADLGVEKTFVIGGTSTLSTSVAQSLPNAERIAGSNRYSTNVAVMERFESDTPEQVMVATGREYADALTGAALAAKQGKGILLIDKRLTQPTRQWIQNRYMQQFVILGGTGAVSQQTEQDLINAYR